MSREKIFGDWNDLLKEEYDAQYFKDLSARIKKEYGTKSILPTSSEVFRAFRECPLNRVKVVILGYEPYSTKQHSNGVAFSTKSKTCPKILVKIREAFDRDIKFGKYMDLFSEKHTLDYLNEQGVLLLNSILTVVEDTPNSHRTIGWDMFIARTLKLLAERKDNIVFLGWGKNASNLLNLINSNGKDHFIHHCEHPSSSFLSIDRDWKNDDCFNKANEYLESKNIEKIIW